jgi:DNA-binding transcriptional ArsR family regulator
MKLKKDRQKHLQRLDDEGIISAFKAMGNAYRMEMLLVLDKNPNITLDQLTELVGGDFKNNSFHTRKLARAGLVKKTYKGASVQHRLSEYGKIAVATFKSFREDPFT